MTLIGNDYIYRGDFYHESKNEPHVEEQLYERGFAPAHDDPAARQVAVAALVVNGPTWQVKANVLARDLLRAYFVEEGVQGVTRPGVREVARHRKK